MFTVKVRDHFLVSHSLAKAAFGPAQQLHGTTYLVDVTFMCTVLDENNVVIEMSEAQTLLKSILDPLDYQNLDEMHIFKGKLTTTEYLAFFIHQELAKALASTFTGKIKVSLGEGTNSWASYEGKV